MRKDNKTTKDIVMRLLNRDESPLSKRHHARELILPSKAYPRGFIVKTHYHQPLLQWQKRRGFILKRNRNTLFLCATYLLLITGAELLTTRDPKLGIVLHIALMFGLLLYAGWESDRNKMLSQFLIVLVVAPIIRILSLSMPIIHFSVTFWFMFISIPVFIAVFTCMWLQRLHPKDIGLTMPTRRRDVPIELGVILIAIPFGLLEYLILKPSPLLNVYAGISSFIALALTMVICTGFLEELTFRGLIQFTTLRVLSKWWGILFISIIFGVLHAGNLTFWDCLLAFSVGFLFSVVRDKTGSIYAISLSHGIINIILFLVAPFYL